MAQNEAKDKICLKAIAPRLMELMREIGTATSESLATMLINKLVYENQNLNAQDTIKRRIYDVINVLSAAGIIEKVGKKLTWHGLKGYGTSFSQPGTTVKKQLPAILPPILHSTDRHFTPTAPLFTPITPIPVPGLPPRALQSKPATPQTMQNVKQTMTLEQKEKLLFAKIKVLSLYKTLIQRNTTMSRPAQSVSFPVLIFGYDSSTSVRIQHDKKDRLIMSGPDPSHVISHREILCKMNFDKENIEAMLKKNPKYSKYTEQALNVQFNDIKFQD